MNIALKFAAVGLLAGVVGTGLGGLLGVLLRLRRAETLALALEFAAGLMLGVVCFDLLPEAFSMAPLLTVLCGCCTGVALGAMAELTFQRGQAATLRGTGILTSLGVAAHNLFEGLAIGAGLLVSGRLGLSLALVIGLHNIPEGVAMAAPLRGSGLSAWRAVAASCAAGLPMAAGAFLGALLSGMTNLMVAFCLALAGGMMIFISFADLIPASKALTARRMPSLGSIAGNLIGKLLTKLF